MLPHSHRGVRGGQEESALLEDRGLQWEAAGALARWLHEREWAWFVTLTHANPMHPEQSHRRLERWLRWVEWHLRRPVRWAGVVDKQERGVLHRHGLLGHPPVAGSVMDCMAAMGAWERIGMGFARVTLYESSRGGACYVADHLGRGAELELGGTWESPTEGEGDRQAQAHLNNRSSIRPSRERTRRLTGEQREAHRQLQALAEGQRLRIVSDAEGWPMIRGKYGIIFGVGPDGPALAVYSNHPRLFNRLLAIPGVQRRQIGDREIQPLVEPQALHRVASLIKARKRRPAMAPGFKPTPTNTTGAPEPRSCPGTVRDMGKPINDDGGGVA